MVNVLQLSLLVQPGLRQLAEHVMLKLLVVARLILVDFHVFLVASMCVPPNSDFFIGRYVFDSKVAHLVAREPKQTN